MKILKKAEQKNFVINSDYYNIYKINEMLYEHEIFYFDNYGYIMYDSITNMESVELRIFTDYINEVKVILDEYGFYTNVAVGENGTNYFINL